MYKLSIRLPGTVILSTFDCKSGERVEFCYNFWILFYIYVCLLPLKVMHARQSVPSVLHIL